MIITVPNINSILIWHKTKHGIWEKLDCALKLWGKGGGFILYSVNARHYNVVML
jgi:hypothetical protein